MCAIPKRRRWRETNNSNTAAETETAMPSSSDTVADAAAETELRRLRSLYGRRATILTPGSAALGTAPTEQKSLLGS